MTPALAAVLLATAPSFPVVAERYTDTYDAERVHRLSDRYRRSAAFTADSARVVLLEGDGELVSVTPAGGERVVLLPGKVPWFVPTPDGKYVIVPGRSGGALTRVSTRGGSQLEIGKGMALMTYGSAVVSPDSQRVAFVESGGALVVGDVLEGLVRKLDVPPPKDARCHFGNASAKGFTPDSKRVLYQHGCDGYELIGVDGKGRVPVPNGAYVPVGDALFGFARSDGFDVVPLRSLEPWVLPTPPLFGFSSPRFRSGARGIGFLAADYAVYWAALDSKKVTRVSGEGSSCTSFMELSPGGDSLFWIGRRTLENRRTRCEAHRWDVATGRDSRLLGIEGTDQCFVRPGKGYAVVNAYHGGGASIWAVNLETLAARRLAGPFPSAGNVQVSPDGRWALIEWGIEKDWNLEAIELPAP